MKTEGAGLDRILVFTGILCLHMALVLPYPILYGGDTVIRLAGFPSILISYQLPLLQLLLHGAMRLFFGPFPIWLLMGIISGMAGAGLYSLALALTRDRTAARLTAAFYGSHPFILYYSHVPYQEPLLLACVTWGFYYLLQDSSRTRLLLSSVLLGAGCLTRYEGWIAAFVAFLFLVRRTLSGRRRGHAAAVLTALAVFGWAPAAWMIWNRGFSPSGTFILSPDFQWERLYRPYFIAKTSIWWTDAATVLLSLLGLALSLAEPGQERDRRRVLPFFALLFFSALIFSAHGIEPDPLRLVTEREAFVPIAMLTLYAGAGAARAAGALRSVLSHAPRMRQLLSFVALTFLVALGLHRGLDRIASANRDPELRVNQEVAEFLAGEGAGALIFARPLPQELIIDYLRRAETSGGPGGREMARQRLQQVDTSPFDYQRILVFSWLGRERILPADALRDIEPSRRAPFLQQRQIGFLVVFSDFEPADAPAGELLSLYALEQNLAFRFQSESKGARVYRIPR